MVTPRIPALRLDPSIVASAHGGWVSLLIRGEVAHGNDLDTIAIVSDGAICNRIVFGRGAAGPSRAFAVVISRPAGQAAGGRLDISLTTHSGARVDEAVTVVLSQDGARLSASFAPHPAVRAPKAAPLVPPLVLQVEAARLDEGRLELRGWIAAARPVVVVQAFVGATHVGSAKLGQCRSEIQAAFPDHPIHAQFLASLPVAGPAPSSRMVRVQAILADGDSQEAEVPLQSAPRQVPAPPRPHAGSEDIRLNCDSATLSGDGAVAIKGWCVARAGLRGVRVLMAGAPLGEATCGTARPDVAAVHPELPGAGTAGFTFMGMLPGEPPAEPRVTLVAEDLLGREMSTELVCERVAAPARPVADLLKINLDSPSVEAGVATAPVTGHLTIEGWAIAQSAVASVEILVDDERLGEAYYGLARPDVAQAFPDNAGAMRSGFTFHCPPRALRNGAHEVAIVFRLEGGLSHTERVRIVVQKSDDADEGGRIRTRMTYAERRHRARVLARLGAPPSFVVHIRGSDGIEATRASLRGQSFAGWALAGDASLNDDTLHVVLGAGDRLGCDALDEFARAAMQSDAGLFYADESLVFPPTGEREAFLKPDFSPELLLATNYAGTGFCVRGSALVRAGIDAATLGSAPAYDIVLRVSECAGVHHVRALLAERGAGAPPVPWEDGAAVQSALERRGLPGRAIAGRVAGTWRVLPAAAFANKVSVIVPTRGAADHIVTCLRGLREGTAHRAIEIVVIDNIAEERSELRALVAAQADAVVRIDAPFNWSMFNNRAAEAATGDMLLFLNDDIEIVERSWLDAMLEVATRPGVGAVGPQLLYPDGRVQHAGMALGRNPAGEMVGRHIFRLAGANDPGYFGLALTQRDVIAVTGACLLVSREKFEAVGRFDEAHAVINNDLDFCLRLHEAGLRCVYTPAATLIHHELASRAGVAETFDDAAFAKRWRTLFQQGDPYFHPGLAGGCDDMRPDGEPVVEIYSGHPLFARDEIRRIVAFKVDHIGDFTTAIPVLRRLKRGFPHAHLTVVGAPAVRGLAGLEPAIDAFVAFESFHARTALGRPEDDDAAKAALGERLRADGCDLAIDLRKHPDTRPLLKLTGAPVLCGFDHQGQFPWLDVAIEWEGDRGLHPKRAHVTDDLACLADAVVAAAEEDREGLSAGAMRRAPPPALPPRIEALFRRPVVALHAGAGNPLRVWPADGFVALAARLLAETQAALLLVGGPDEVGGAAAMLRAIRAAAGPALSRRIGSVVGAVPLCEMPPLLARCAAYVGNNSGPVHLAAASGVPVVGVYSGCVDPTEWAPLGPDAVAVYRTVSCSPCYIADAERCPRQIACLTGISPARVFDVVRRMLTLGRPGDEARRPGYRPAERSRSSAG